MQPISQKAVEDTVSGLAILTVIGGALMKWKPWLYFKRNGKCMDPKCQANVEAIAKNLIEYRKDLVEYKENAAADREEIKKQMVKVATNVEWLVEFRKAEIRSTKLRNPDDLP